MDDGHVPKPSQLSFSIGSKYPCNAVSASVSLLLQDQIILFQLLLSYSRGQTPSFCSSSTPLRIQLNIGGFGGLMPDTHLSLWRWARGPFLGIAKILQTKSIFATISSLPCTFGSSLPRTGTQLKQTLTCSVLMDLSADLVTLFAGDHIL
uniref:Uncharacterized protein n=2 Tax=Schistocephalus solidus TaxID=70667 RepID=A0A0V0J5Q9_SCHSO